MKKLFLISTFLLAINIVPSSGENGCWPEPAKYFTWFNCPEGSDQTSVVRCDCGNGPCTPSMQLPCNGGSQ